jgi:hypothetical protein
VSRAWAKYRGLRRSHFHRRLRPAMYAPYPAGVYRGFLERMLKHRRVHVLPFASAVEAGERAALFVRHDIDTAACVRSMNVLLGIDAALGITPGIYFRADRAEYELAACREQARRYRAAGFEVGLHTSCYVDDDFLQTFRAETRAFVDVFGFAPTSFTVHGLGQQRFDTRLKFYGEICGRLTEFGYRFSDCCEQQRSYDYVFHDSHFDKIRGERFIYDDLNGRNFPFVPGKSYVLLTHPCYWT